MRLFSTPPPSTQEPPIATNDIIKTRFSSIDNQNSNELYRVQLQRNMIQRLQINPGSCKTCGMKK